MIARTWRGWTSAADAVMYHRYLLHTGVREYRRTPGNLGVHVLRRIEGDRAEFLLLTYWESEAALHAFAGADASRAVFYPEDERYLVEYDRHAVHFDVLPAGELR